MYKFSKHSHTKMQTSILKKIYLPIFLLLSTNIFGQLQANFSADMTAGCGALAGIQFSDLSTGNPTSWLWDFDNGNSSSLQNPTANYTSPGLYTVKLTVSLGGSSNTITKTNYIEVFRKPVANFTVGNNIGCPPLPVQFTNTSTLGDGPITQFIWDFGDGSPPGNNANQTHTYQTGGSFPVSLQIIDQNNCSDNKIFNSVNVTTPPRANFGSAGNPNSCSVPHTVNFTNSSQGTGLSYLWNFGDGSTSTQQAPTHSYTSFGNYTVSLKVSDSNCDHINTKANFVKLGQVNAQFSNPSDTICLGSPYLPTNLSIGATLYRWNFGNGASSSSRSPSYIFPDSGWHKIELLASNGPACLGSYRDSVYVQKILADFTTSINYSCNRNDSFAFNATTNQADTFKWFYGLDSGRYSLGKNLVLDNVFQGVYNDTLIAISKYGCSTKVIKPANRTIDYLWLSIINSNITGCAPYTGLFQQSYTGPGPITQYDWSFGNGITSSLANPDSISFPTSGNYKVSLTVSNALGCSAVDVFELKLGDPQSPSFSFPFDTICPTDSIVILNNSQDTNSIDIYHLSYYSSIYQDFITIDSFQNFVIGPFQDTGYHNILLTTFDSNCKSDTKQDSVFYVTGPFAEYSYSSDCINRLLIQFNGQLKKATRFYWDFGDGSPINSVDVSPTHSYQSLGSYGVTLVAFNDNNGCDSAVYSDTLFLIPPQPIGISSNNTVCLPDSVHISINNSSYVNPIWTIGLDTISTSTSFYFKPDTVGSYNISLQVNDKLGCSYQGQKNIEAFNPKADFSSISQMGCIPFNLDLINTSTFNTVVTKWRWQLNGIDTSKLKSPSLLLIDPIDYSIELFLENQFGCKDSILKQNFISLDFMEANFIENRRVICQGDSVHFRNLSTGNQPKYKWLFGDGLSDTTIDVTHTFNTAGIFSVSLIITDSSGCNDTLTKPNIINVEANPLVQFSSDTSKAKCYPLAVNFADQSSGTITNWNWDFGDNSSSIFQNPFHNYTLPGKYDVSLTVRTNNGCSASIVKSEYIETEGPIANFTMNKDSICINEFVSFSITNSQNIYSHSWDFGDGLSAIGSPIDHSYSQRTGELYPTLILSDSTGFCIVSIKDTLFVQNVKADFSSSDTLGCGIPSEIKFTNNSIGENQFLWVINNETISNRNPSYTFNQFGNYSASLFISSNIGCKDTTQQNIVIAPKPTISLTQNTGICLGDSVFIQASGGLTYSWNPTNSLRFINPKEAWAKPTSTTIYEVITFNQHGCTDTGEVAIAVTNPPLNYSLEDSTIIIGETIDANVFIGPLYNYQWTPSNGLSCNNCPNPKMKPEITTTYYLTMFDDFGCYEIKDTVTITVDFQFSIDVPTAFSPNGDNTNDIIYANGWGIKELTAFKIYNRFGELVFESTDLEKGWNGEYKGKPQPIETYIFTVEAESYSGEHLSKKGNISLIR
jgi:gliding motility-associated-like protein